MKKYHGIIPPIVVPLDEQERVNEASFRQLLNYCIAGGVDGIFVASSNGEAMALTQKERERSIAIALDECAGKVPVLAGVMDSSTTRVIDNLKRFEQMGGAAAVVTPVFYARHATPRETIRHFEEISKHTSIDIIIYNIPIFTGTTLRAETIFELAKIDHVVGYKDSSGNMADFEKCLIHFKDDPKFSLLQGSMNISAISMLIGADGCVPSMAALYPKLFRDLYRAAKAKDIERTLALEKIVMETCRIFSLALNQTAATKYAVSTLGFFDKRVAKPTEPTTPEEEVKIKAQVKLIWEMMEKEGIQ